MLEGDIERSLMNFPINMIQAIIWKLKQYDLTEDLLQTGHPHKLSKYAATFISCEVIWN